MKSGVKPLRAVLCTVVSRRIWCPLEPHSMNAPPPPPRKARFLRNKAPSTISVPLSVR
ncbi:hypothetical protein D3C83_262040 [compost metagenome]